VPGRRRHRDAGLHPLYSSIAAQTKALRDATTGGFFPYSTFSLDMPFLIGLAE
jgi:hypothetical protein